MALRDGGRFVLGPLSIYSCDGIGIARAGTDHGVPYYRVEVFEANVGGFDPRISTDKYSQGAYRKENEKGDILLVYMTDDELEEFFMAWQILKKERESYK